MGGKHPPEGMVVIWERVCLPTRSSTGLSAKSVRAPLRYVEALRCLPRCLVKLASGGAGSHGGLPRIVVPLESVVCPGNGVARKRVHYSWGQTPFRRNGRDLGAGVPAHALSHGAFPLTRSERLCIMQRRSVVYLSKAEQCGGRGSWPPVRQLGIMTGQAGSPARPPRAIPPDVSQTGTCRSM